MTAALSRSRSASPLLHDQQQGDHTSCTDPKIAVCSMPRVQQSVDESWNAESLPEDWAHFDLEEGDVSERLLKVLSQEDGDA
jgi:hypothetical protein